MAQVLMVTRWTELAKAGKEKYESYWTIPNWREVRKSRRLFNNQEAVFKTGSSPNAVFKTEWVVGLKLVPYHDSVKKVRFYWKLMEIHGSPSTHVEARLYAQLLEKRTNSRACVIDKTVEVRELEIVEGTYDYLHFKPNVDAVDRDFICPDGTVGFRLVLEIKKPTSSPSEYDGYKMEQFSKSAVESLRRDQVSLLYDHPNADLKFLTSDGVEIQAHKAVLRARCPVFDGMLNCDLTENTTGVIRMTDITGKTMKIVLHYFYVGELLPSWCDPDTIVEFTYAAGKYQMTEVLELLDDMLGSGRNVDVSNLDVQLLNLVGKLELVNAEARLLKRIVAKIKKLTTGDDLFELFGFEEEVISEMVENLTTGQAGQSRILKLMDSLFDGIDTKVLYEKGMPLLAFARKEELKRVEKNLLKMFADLAAGLGNANQLFTLFCHKR